ncbi:MAG: hypothetical protein ACK4TA_24975 [Saprospiraceae bacterium]
MDYKIIYITSIVAIAMIGVFIKMKPGFGPLNLKVLAITLSLCLAVLLAVLDLKPEILSAAYAIIGTVAGYAFGIKTRQEE